MLERQAAPRVLAISLLASLACQAPAERESGELPIDPPLDWSAAQGIAHSPAPRPFWLEFEDVGLQHLIEKVLAGNHELGAAAARVEQALAQARIAGAALSPGVRASLARNRQRQNFVGFPIGGGAQQVLSTTSTSWGLSLDLSWELDLWGKLDAAEKAALADAAASEADWQAARLSLAGQAAKAWFARAAANEQLHMAQQNVTSFTQSARVVRERFQQGRVGALDYSLIEGQLASAKAARDRQLELLERTSRQLEILMGDYPSATLEPPTQLPQLPGPVPIGLPSELLQRRPDLVSATRRLRAADLRLYQARKELWPSFSLTASAGRRSNELADLGKSSFDVWGLVANLTQPIFEGGRLRAGIDLADARVREAVESWSQAVLTAFGEVEIALAVATHHDDIVSEREQASRHARAAAAIAESRYEAGRGDVLALLTAQRQSFDAQSALIEGRRARLEARLDLYLALGGGFDSAQPAWGPEQGQEPAEADHK